MRKVLIMLLVAALSIGFPLQAYASDWDKAGKILTGMEGLRIITGGKVDFVGSMFGINNRRGATHYTKHKKRRHYRQNHHASCNCSKKVWVPHYRWEKKFIPRHEEYSKRYGRKIIVRGHYVTYKVQHGGHWETKYTCY